MLSEVLFKLLSSFGKSSLIKSVSSELYSILPSSAEKTALVLMYTLFPLHTRIIGHSAAKTIFPHSGIKINY